MATVVFDLDGTLIDCRARHYACYWDILAEMDIRPLAAEEYWLRRMAGEGTFDVVSKLSDEESRSFRITWMSRIERRDYLAPDRPFAGAAPALAELSRHHHLVLLTLRRDAEALAWQLERTGLGVYFHDVISPWSDVPARKSELLGDWYPMGETWVIGDTEADIDLAADLGARCIALTSGVRSQDFLHSRGGLLTLDSVAELPSFLANPMPATPAGSPMSRFAEADATDAFAFRRL
jgi:phosphoglycolate phosphatase